MPISVPLPIAKGGTGATTADGIASGHQHLLSELKQSGASTNQVPTWDGTAWVPQTPAAAQPAKQKIAHEFLVRGQFVLGQGWTNVQLDGYLVNAGREIYAEFTYADPFGMLSDELRNLIVNLPVAENYQVYGTWLNPSTSIYFNTGARFGDIFRFKFINPPSNKPLQILQATWVAESNTYYNDPSTVLTVSNDSIYSLIFNGTQWVPESTLTGVLAATEQKIPIRGQLSRTGTINEFSFPTFTQLGAYGWPPAGNIAANPDESTMYGMNNRPGNETGSAGIFDLTNTSGRTALFSVSAYAEIMHNSSSSAIFGLRLAKNGVSIPQTESQENSSTNNPAFLTTEWLVELAHGDSVNMNLAQITGTLSTITFRRGRLVAVEVT